MAIQQTLFAPWPHCNISMFQQQQQHVWMQQKHNKQQKKKKTSTLNRTSGHTKDNELYIPTVQNASNKIQQNYLILSCFSVSVSLLVYFGRHLLFMASSILFFFFSIRFNNFHYWDYHKICACIYHFSINFMNVLKQTKQAALRVLHALIFNESNSNDM